MFDPIEINRIKHQVAIADVLASRGIMPIRERGGELAYCSPLRTDGTPSFYVNVRANVFKDVVVTDHRGDVIRLVQLLDRVSFAETVRTLQEFEQQPSQPIFFLSGQLASVMPASTEHIIEVKLLQTPSLLRYVESRGIGVANARMYLRQVHYMSNGKYRFVPGLPNDSQGYALRYGSWCKRNIGPMDITTIAGTRPDCQVANIFEGQYNFLSALEHFGQGVPSCTTYILNSLSNLHRIMERLKQYNQINCYLDRDSAGREHLEELRRGNLPVIDRSGLYEGCNDFNEWLTALKNCPTSC